MTDTTKSPPSFSSLAAKLVVAGDRPESQVEFEAQVVDFFVQAAELLGMPKSVAAIYGIVFASPEPLSFAEIERRLDLSKGSISQGLRMLREMGALKEVSLPSDRAELFEPDLEMRQVLVHFLENRVERQLKSGGEQLDRLLDRVGSFRSVDQKVLRQRVKKLDAWHAKSRALLPIIRAFLKLGA